MDEHGRVHDVLVEDVSMVDDTGLKSISKQLFIVWADSGCVKLIEEVPGVASAGSGASPNRYSVCVDPRYDFEFVKAEVVAVLKCR
jgi:hypothetical protein